MAQCFMDTPVGRIRMVEKDGFLTQITFTGEKCPDVLVEENEILMEAKRQLTAYFEGKLKKFSLPLNPSGTEFYQTVWKALTEIPYGKTKSYGDIAKAIGNPLASRAVGMANHNNPIAIVVPCHRVIGKNGQLTGYAGGLEIKKYLLRLEHRHTLTDF